MPDELKISQHEGKKYLRRIQSAPGTMFVRQGETTSIEVDVYAVLEAFKVTCPARAHAIKKLLCAGERGKGDSLADLKGALAAVSRAIELEEARDNQDDSVVRPENLEWRRDSQT